MRYPTKFWMACAILALATSVTSAPIRVGFFKGTGPTRYWNPNMHTAGNALANVLASPDSAQLGAALVKPVAGISLSFYGVPYVPTDTLHLLKTPTEDQKAAFIAALDSLDVIVFSNSTGLDAVFTEPAQRQKLDWFFKTRGVVGLHWTWQTGGNGPAWGAWDSLPGTRSGGWIVENMGTLRRETAAHDPASRFLNRGLPDTARFREKWISFTQLPAALRATPGLKATMTLDSASLVGGGANVSLSNQPYSWFRELPQGGRFFYTGLGHRIELFTGDPFVDSASDTTRPANNFLRRQLYNAILWTAGVDSNGVVSVRSDASKQSARFHDAAHLTFNRGALSISILHEGTHSIELRGVEGRRVAIHHGTGKKNHSFTGLQSGVRLVIVTTPQGRHLRRVVIP